MDTVNGCLIIGPSADGEFSRFGPAEVEGAYLAELVGGIRPGDPAPPVHVHPTTDEAFYLASGEATFRLGGRDIRLTAGSFVFVPRGVTHTVWNSGTDPLRGLIVISPGGREHIVQPVESG
jgi:mannose-6-phosphate isomerase-like protein (cupin superfamily)